jgi:hypothetical protein
VQGQSAAAAKPAAIWMRRMAEKKFKNLIFFVWHQSQTKSDLNKDLDLLYSYLIPKQIFISEASAVKLILYLFTFDKNKLERFTWVSIYDLGYTLKPG